MAEFFGCDPERLRQLTDRLTRAADVLARRGPVIRDDMAAWHSAMSFQLLAQETTRLGDDARAMARRADLALAIDDMPKWTSPDAPSNWLNGVPWDPTDLDVANGARTDVTRLRNALDNPDERWAREAIREVGQTLADHKYDPAYLQAFYASGGAEQSARLARQLHEQDGTHDLRPLSEESERIIGQYAAALASATKMARDGRLQLAPNAFDPVVHPPNGDMWSAAMLLRYGPRGDAYDAHFLADMGRSVLDWRDHHPARPSFSPDTVTAGGYAPGGYVDPDGAWYSSLGLETNYLHKNADEAAANLGSIQANDPALAVLGRVSENGYAARDLLSGEDGLKRARQLVDEHWGTPGYIFTDEGQVPGQVLYAAASDRSPEHAQQSAQAAANIFQAASDNYAADQRRSDYDKEQYPQLPPSLSKSLSAVASGYVVDLAKASGATLGTPTAAVDRDGPWLVMCSPAVVDGLLHEIQLDPAAMGAFRGAVEAHITTATWDRALHPASVTATLQSVGRLYGFVAQVEQDVHWDAAQARDAANARAQVYFDAVTGALGNAPGPTPVGVLQSMLGLGAPFAKDALFPTDNASRVEAASDAALYDALNSMRPQVAEGLIAAGKLPPPTGEHWFGADGHIHLTRQDLASFEAWWADQPEQYTAFEDQAQAGFEEATNQRAPNDHAHGPR
jgi:hypothetical protein